MSLKAKKNADSKKSKNVAVSNNTETVNTTDSTELVVQPRKGLTLTHPGLKTKRLDMDDSRKKSLDLALSAIEKQFGKGAIMKLDTKQAAERIPVIPTGCLSLDLALGIGGIPQGRIIEIYGPESSGKTTLTLHIAAECQKMGGTVAFVDAEHALDTVYAAKLGVDIPNTLISQPDSGEQALEIVDMLVRSGSVNLLIVDSVAALTPKAELEGEMGDSHMGLQARLMSQALRKLTGSIAKSNCTVIFINQLRMKIGVMFGNPETTTGGNALKFYASVRIDVRRVASLKDGEENIGNRTKAKIVKNKVAPPFKECEYDIMFGEGISISGCLVDEGEKQKIIDKSGAWYSYNNMKIGQGRENSKTFLEENPEMANEIYGKILDKHFGNPANTKPEAPTSQSEASSDQAENQEEADQHGPEHG